MDGAVIAASRHVDAVAAFDRSVDDEVLTFSLRAEQFIDDQTSSTWDIFGRATAGPLVVRQPSLGNRLRPLVNANHIQFAWAVFGPLTHMWGP